MQKPIINVADVDLVARPPEGQTKGANADQFEMRIARISASLGAKALGYNVTAVAPGKRAFPFHSHHVNEEMFYLAVSTRVSPEVCEYPDSSKFGVYGQFNHGPGAPRVFRYVGREHEAVD